MSELAGVIERDRSQLEALARGAGDRGTGPRRRARGGARRSARARALRAGAHAAGSRPPTRTPSRSLRDSARRRWSAPASSSWKISSIGCCSSASGTRRSAPPWRSSSRASALETLAEQADLARDAGQKAAAELAQLLQELASAREQEREQSEALKALRARWQQSLGLKVSTEALQQAALGKASGKVTEWLKSQSLDQNPRVGAAAACRARLGARGRDRARLLSRGRMRRRPGFGHGSAGRLRRRASGGRERRLPRAAGPRSREPARPRCRARRIWLRCSARCSRPRRLPEALRMPPQPRPGQSVVTRDGVWLGADWLRLSRDPEPHTGVIEREETLRALRAEVSRLEAEVKEREQRARAAPRAGARLRGSARAAADGSEPTAPRARRPARGARFGASAQGRCRAAG